MGLNLSRLSRNFEEEPVIWKNHTIGFENKPTREDLYYLYIEENLSIEEKRKIAKENNLNWVEFFNEEKFKEYFINGV